MRRRINYPHSHRRTDANGCSAEAFVQVIVNPLPTFVFELSTMEVCLGEPVTFTNYFTGVAPWTVQYTYNGIPDSFTTSDNPEFFTEYFAETTLYETFSVTDGNGCTASLNQSATITVNPLPELSCPVSMEAYVDDLPVLLDAATPAGADYYFDPSTGIGSYEITYCYEDPLTGCADCCTFLFHVLAIPGDGQIISG